MEYLEEISWELEKLNLPAGDTEEVQGLIESAFKEGLARRKPTNQLEGYSNLTEAIKSKQPIDWEKLDGKKVKCEKSDVYTLQGELKRFSHYYPFTSNAWWDDDADSIYASAFKQAWDGADGWTLWLEGEIPLRRKTADQLEVGHFFTGKSPDRGVGILMCVGRKPGNGKHVQYAIDLTTSQYPASEWVVLEEHGPFIKPESN